MDKVTYFYSGEQSAHMMFTDDKGVVSDVRLSLEEAKKLQAMLEAFIWHKEQHNPNDQIEL
jgi:hypothetical protein